MARYAIIENSVVSNTIEADEDFAQQIGAIPADSAAIGDHYIDGEFVSPEPPAPEMPQTVTMRQARLAMLSAGILDDVESLIQQMPGDEGRAARIDWEYALDVRRDWPLIDGLGSQLGMTDQQIDDLFVAAASVPQ